MAPSAKALREALIEGTCDVFKLEPDTTSVNKVRHHVEQKLGLEEDFFSGKGWKQQSKEVIKEYVVSIQTLPLSIGTNCHFLHCMRQGKLLDGWTPEDKKKDSKAPQRKQTKAKDSEDDATGSSSPEKKRKRTEADPSNDDDLDGEDEPNKKAKSESKSPNPVVDEEEYSDVIDEPATSKRKKTKKEPGQKKAAPKAPKPAKSAAARRNGAATAAAAAAEQPSDPLEAEVKKLQGQLGKCGVRKLWHHELKGCDDARAKVRHLKRMLTDVGIEGRFSEAKAREIKETRELLADAEAAQEMNRLWGMDSGGRKSRHKSRGAKTVAESDDGDAENEDEHRQDGGGDGADDDGGENEVHQGNGKDDDDDDEDEDVSFAARRRRAHADLAFLGDDSDSD